MKNLLIITGCPGTGKSYWGKLIQDRYTTFQLLSFDELKEAYWDRYGFNNNEEKYKLNDECLQEFYRLLDRKMALNLDIIIEYPFCRKHIADLQRLIQEHSYNAITLYLYGDYPTIYQRAQQRDTVTSRHMGHLLSCYHKGISKAPVTADAGTKLSLQEFIDSCLSKDYDIRLGQNLPIDITYFDRIDYEDIYRKLDLNIR